MRVVIIALVLGALGAGCKKKPALVKTPVRELAPLGGAATAPVTEPEPTQTAQQPVQQEPAPTDAGVSKVARPAKPVVPSVANPYVQTPGSAKLPMYKQRARFF